MQKNESVVRRQLQKFVQKKISNYLAGVKYRLMLMQQISALPRVLLSLKLNSYL